MTDNEIGTIVVDAAIAVHKELGQGLFETVYDVGSIGGLAWPDGSSY